MLRFLKLINPFALAKNIGKLAAYAGLIGDTCNYFNEQAVLRGLAPKEDLEKLVRADAVK